MGKANPTLLGNAKNVYIRGGGETHTFIRCDKCKVKYIKESNPGGCPTCCNTKLPSVKKSAMVDK